MSTNPVATVSRYWHTLRYLEPAQIVHRLVFRLTRPRIDTRPAPSFGRPDVPWIQGSQRRQSFFSPDNFAFLNETRSLSEHGWDSPALSKLWRYNLHYFDDLIATAAEHRVDEHRVLLTRWVAENPPGHGTGWEPYPTSLRIINWIKWALAGHELPSSCVQSLAVQTRWLMGRLERHLRGNHLFVNAKALVFAGLYFEGAEAAAWLAQGLALLSREIPEQVLADGGQFELSPMYHALALEDMLDLVNVATAFRLRGRGDRYARCVDRWRAVIVSMCAWLEIMSHPDGEISFFNDAAIDIAPAPRDVYAYARRLAIDVPVRVDASPTHLDASGFIRIERASAVALLDVGRVGPDYLPAHAHADTLSFELSLFGHRVIVNSGTSEYGAGIERLRQRGTAAHNTVVVDQHDSSEVWSGFRVARRAHPHDLSISAGDPIRVACSHDGYRRLPGRPVHSRRWLVSSTSLMVEDSVVGGFGVAEARFHLHPDVSITQTAENDFVLSLAGEREVRVTVEVGEARYEPATWHPGFGRTVATTVLRVSLVGGRSAVRIAWGARS